MKKILFLTLMLLSNTALAQLKVVTTMSSYADIAKNIGADLVEVNFVASPKFNPHFIEPRPSDVLRVKNADLFIHSGLDLEAWRGPLVDAAANADIRTGGSKELDLSTGISILEVPDKPISRSDGDIHIFGNPHYWTDPRNGLIIAKEIAAKLILVDPKNQSVYQANLDSFIKKLQERINYWQDTFSPYQGKELIGYHNEWIYLIKFAGLKMDKYLEPKAGIPPTAKQIAYISDYIKVNNIKGIVQATYFPKDAAEEIANNTSAKVITLCQNVEELKEVDTYIKMIDYNLSQIMGALK